MKTKWMRILSLCLAVLLLCGMLPHAMAAETDAAPTGAAAPSEESVTAETEPPADATEAASEPGEPVTKPEDSEEIPPVDLEEVPVLLAASGYALTRDSNPDGYVYKNGLIWSSDSSKEFEATFNGVTRHVERLSTFVVKDNGKYVPCYCIAPSVPYETSESYTANEWPTQNAWDNLTESQRQAIGLALLYGYPNGISPTNSLDKKGAQGATQMIIWEICYGMRNATHPYACTDSRFIELYNPDSVGNEFTDGASGAGNGTIYNLNACYQEISSKMAAHSVLPNFTVSDSGFAQTYEMKANGDGTYSLTLEDTNNILSECAFTNTSDLTFTKNGNKLTITAKKALSNVTVKGTKNVPNLDTQTFIIWTYDDKQTMAQPLAPTNDPTPFYFKLKVSSGSLALTKTTEDGKNLSGWKFGIYSDKDCKKLLSGPHTTDSTGKISVTGLSAGDIWVKELGHEDAAIDAQYECASTNPQKVTITSGETATVSFHNKLTPGACQIVKTATNGGTVEGWEFTITDADDNAVGTYTTDATGTIVVDLNPGTYTVQETARDDPYWYCDTEPQTVTVKAGETASVTFHNQWIGKAKIIKTLENPEAGTVEGWTFTISKVYEKNGAMCAEYLTTVTTSADGIILQDLEPGDYLIAEELEEDSLWQCVSTQSQMVSVKAGETAEVTFTNALRPGEIRIQKVDTKGEPLEGVEFLLEWSEDGTTWQPVTYTDSAVPQIGGCTTEGLTNGKLLSDEAGLVTFSGLHPKLQYRLTETATKNGYQLLADYAYEGGLPAEDDLIVTLTVVNAEIFTLPNTGSHAPVLLPIGIALCLAVSMGAVMSLCKRKSE